MATLGLGVVEGRNWCNHHIVNSKSLPLQGSAQVNIRAINYNVSLKIFLLLQHLCDHAEIGGKTKR